MINLMLILLTSDNTIVYSVQKQNKKKLLPDKVVFVICVQKCCFVFCFSFCC